MADCAGEAIETKGSGTVVNLNLLASFCEIVKVYRNVKVLGHLSQKHLSFKRDRPLFFKN